MVGGTAESTSVNMGNAQVHRNSTWLTFCPLAFNKMAADLVCRLIGFDKSEILLAGSFGKTGYEALE